jgi:hypothetical protein
MQKKEKKKKEIVLLHFSFYPGVLCREFIRSQQL